MIHENIAIQVEGSQKDTCLSTYILDTSSEMEAGKKPLVLICPGGAYRFTSDREAEPVALQFIGMGYHAAVLRYSCAPSRFPTALMELASCVKLIKENGEKWNVDTERIFILGFSAGGHLAASYGVFWNRDFLAKALQCKEETRKVKGLILCYPVITSKREYTHEESMQNLLGDKLEEKRGEMALETQVGMHVPQTFMWHTYADETVPFQNSLLFLDALGKAGVPAEYHLFPEGEHGLSLADETTVRSDGSGIQRECKNWMPLLKIWLKRICEK